MPNNMTIPTSTVATPAALATSPNAGESEDFVRRPATITSAQINIAPTGMMTGSVIEIPP